MVYNIMKIRKQGIYMFLKINIGDVLVEGEKIFGGN